MFDPFESEHEQEHSPVRTVRRSSRQVIPNRRYNDSGEEDDESDSLPSLEYTPVSGRNSGEDRGMN